MPDNVTIELMKTMGHAIRQVTEQICANISKIRYGPVVGDAGFILFDFMGEEMKIPEPHDVILVDDASASAAKLWIANHYWETLCDRLAAKKTA